MVYDNIGQNYIEEVEDDKIKTIISMQYCIEESEDELRKNMRTELFQNGNFIVIIKTLNAKC